MGNILKKKKKESEGSYFGAEAGVFKLSWQLGRVYVTSFLATRDWRQREKPTIHLESFIGSVRFIFSKTLATSFNAIISEFGPWLARNNIAEEQP